MQSAPLLGCCIALPRTARRACSSPAPCPPYAAALAAAPAAAVPSTQFFPDIYAASLNSTNTDPYCVYNSHTLQLFSASMFLSGAVAALPAGYAARAYGRRIMMFVSGCLFVLGGGLQAGAQNVAMLVCGRLILGCGVGERGGRRAGVCVAVRCACGTAEPVCSTARTLAPPGDTPIARPPPAAPARHRRLRRAGVHL